MEIKIQFNPNAGLVVMAIGPGVVFMEPATFRNFYSGMGQVGQDIADWELKRGNGELNTESALIAFEEMLRNGW